MLKGHHKKALNGPHPVVVLMRDDKSTGYKQRGLTQVAKR